jgi:hypothetical protein
MTPMQMMSHKRTQKRYSTLAIDLHFFDLLQLEENISQQPVEEVYDYSGGLSVSESEDEG